VFFGITRVRVAVALVAAGSLIAPCLASAQAGGDARSRRDQVRAQQATTAARLDALRATDAELQAALQALDRDVRAQEGAVEDARRGVARAEADIADAEAAQQRTQAEIDRLETRQQSLAVDSYMRSGSNSDSVEVLGESDLVRVAERQAMIELTGGRNADLADELAGARQDLADQRAQAEEAAQRADEQRARAERRLDDLAAARARQAAFAADVDQRIESRLAEAAGLEQLDAQLSAQIAAQQAAQQAALRAQVPVSSAGGGTSPVPFASGGGDISLVSVGGITVARSLGGPLQGLLNAARAAGLSLGGGGYRDPAAQMAVRRNNCPDPINSPPSACSPPTARVGTSLHEQGLAIDFTSGGALIRSRSDRAYIWLAANAGRFGLRNLPSEPWHWSTTGG